MIINLHISPYASQSQIIGWQEDGRGGKTLKIKVAAPPVDGQANSEIIRFLAKEWGISKSALEITGGSASRTKRLKINDLMTAARILATVTKA